MRTTVTLDDEQLAQATRLAGPMDRTTLLNEALKAFVEREASRRLARLGGSQPKLALPSRRRAERSR